MKTPQKKGDMSSAAGAEDVELEEENEEDMEEEEEEDEELDEEGEEGEEGEEDEYDEDMDEEDEEEEEEEDSDEDYEDDSKKPKRGRTSKNSGASKRGPGAKKPTVSGPDMLPPQQPIVAEKPLPKSNRILKVSSKPFQYETTIRLEETVAFFEVKDLTTGEIVSRHEKPIPEKDRRNLFPFLHKDSAAGVDSKEGILDGKDDVPPSSETVLLQGQMRESDGTAPDQVAIKEEMKDEESNEAHLARMDHFANEELWEEVVRRQSVFVCICGMVFKEQALFALHKPCHHPEGPRRCAHCIFKAEDYGDFIKHLYSCPK